MIQPGWPGMLFRAAADETVLADLRERLKRTRLPVDQAGRDWQTGTPISYAARLLEYWRHGFDWRAWEARINELTQRLVEIDGQTIHVIVERGSGDRPMALLMTNGWPGSFLEFVDIIDALAHPERHGGRIEDAFTVIIPSLPGYGYSPPPKAPLSPARIAEIWSKLITDAFGFDRYVAYGSDWGSLVTATLALNHPESLSGILITSAGVVPAIDEQTQFSDEELAWQQRTQQMMAPESGYQIVQATKPQSLAYGHTDSPIALACWIIEKFHGWTTPGSSDDPLFPMDQLLANVMLYWLNGAVAPMWLYLFLDRLPSVKPGQKISVPSAFLFAPNDLMPAPPRSWLERSYNVASYRIAEFGGHFPAMDCSEVVIDELRRLSAGCSEPSGASAPHRPIVPTDEERGAARQ